MVRSAGKVVQVFTRDPIAVLMAATWVSQQPDQSSCAIAYIGK